MNGIYRGNINTAENCSIVRGGGANGKKVSFNRGYDFSTKDDLKENLGGNYTSYKEIEERVKSGNISQDDADKIFNADPAEGCFGGNLELTQGQGFFNQYCNSSITGWKRTCQPKTLSGKTNYCSVKGPFLPEEYKDGNFVNWEFVGAGGEDINKDQKITKEDEWPIFSWGGAKKVSVGTAGALACGVLGEDVFLANASTTEKGNRKINSKSFSSFTTHKEPTLETITNQLGVLQSAPSIDLPVDNPRRMSFYDKNKSFQEIDYPNVFGLRTIALSDETDQIKTQKIETALDVLLSDKVSELQKLPGAGNVTSKFFDPLFAKISKEKVVDALLWLDKPLSQKNLEMFLGAFSDRFSADKYIARSNNKPSAGYELMEITGSLASVKNSSGLKVAFEKQNVPVSDEFLSAQLAELASLEGKPVEQNLLPKSLQEQSNTSSSENSNTDDSFDGSCNTLVFSWTTSCLIPWLSGLPEKLSFGPKNLISFDDEGLEVPSVFQQETEKKPSEKNSLNTALKTKNVSPNYSVFPEKITLFSGGTLPVELQVFSTDKNSDKNANRKTVRITNPEEVGSFFQIISPTTQTLIDGKVSFFLNPLDAITKKSGNIVLVFSDGTSQTVPISFTDYQTKTFMSASKIVAGTSSVNIDINVLDTTNKISSVLDTDPVILKSSIGTFSSDKVILKNGRGTAQFFPTNTAGDFSITIQIASGKTPVETIYGEILPSQPSRIVFPKNPLQIAVGSDFVPIEAFVADSFGNTLPEHEASIEFTAKDLEIDTTSGFAVRVSDESSGTILVESSVVRNKSAPLVVKGFDEASFLVNMPKRTIQAGELDTIGVVVKTISKKNILNGTFSAEIIASPGAGVFPQNINIKDGVADFSFTPSKKAGKYSFSIKAKGFSPAEIWYEVQAADPFRFHINSKQSIIDIDNSAGTAMSVEVLDAYGNIVKNYSGTTRLKINPPIKNINNFSANTTAQLASFGLEASFLENADDFQDSFFKNESFPDWISTTPTVKTERNEKFVPINIENGVGTFRITPKNSLGDLYLLVPQKNSIAPATQKLEIAQILSHSDFSRVSPESILTSLFVPGAGNLEAPNLANRFLFGGKTLAVATSITKNVSAKTWWNKKQNNSEIGWKGDSKFQTLFAAQNSVGKSLAPFADEFTLLFGDPTVHIPKTPQTFFDKTLGTPIWKSPHGPITQIAAGDLNEDGAVDVFVKSGGKIETLFGAKNSPNTFKNTGQILERKTIKKIVTYNDVAENIIYFIVLEKNGNVLFFQNTNGVLKRVLIDLGFEQFGIRSNFSNVWTGNFNADSFRDLLWLSPENKLFVSYGNAQKNFDEPKLFYDFKTKFIPVEEHFSVSKKSDTFKNLQFLPNFFTRFDGMSSDVSPNNSVFSGESFGSLFQNKEIDSSFVQEKLNEKNSTTIGEKITSNLSLKSSKNIKNLKVFIPSFSGLGTSVDNFSCTGCKKESVLGGIIIHFAGQPKSSFAIQWDSFVINIPEVSVYIEDFAGKDGVDDIAVPLEINGIKQVFQIRSIGAQKSLPKSIQNVSKEVSIIEPDIENKKPKIFSKTVHLAQNLNFLEELFQSKNIKKDSEGNTKTESGINSEESLTDNKNINSKKESAAALDEHLSGGNPRAEFSDENEKTPFIKNSGVIGGGFTHSFSAQSLKSTGGITSAETAQLNVENIFENPDASWWKKGGVLDEIAKYTCGGSCGLPLPSYVFTPPGNQSLYLPPFGFPSLPTLPIPVVGLPLLQIGPLIPPFVFILPFTPSFPNSLFRFFVAPSTTGQIGMSLCIGPPSGFSVPPLPLGNCFTFVLPLLDIIGACPADPFLAISPAVQQTSKVFASGSGFNTGTFSFAPIPESKNKKAVSADVISMWIDKQMSEINNFKWPQFKIVLPDFLSTACTGEDKASCQKQKQVEKKVLKEKREEEKSFLRSFLDEIDFGINLFSSEKKTTPKLDEKIKLSRKIQNLKLQKKSTRDQLQKIQAETLSQNPFVEFSYEKVRIFYPSISYEEIQKLKNNIEDFITYFLMKIKKVFGGEKKACFRKAQKKLLQSEEEALKSKCREHFPDEPEKTELDVFLEPLGDVFVLAQKKAESEFRQENVLALEKTLLASAPKSSIAIEHKDGEQNKSIEKTLTLKEKQKSLALKSRVNEILFQFSELQKADLLFISSIRIETKDIKDQAVVAEITNKKKELLRILQQESVLISTVQKKYNLENIEEAIDQNELGILQQQQDVLQAAASNDKNRITEIKKEFDIKKQTTKKQRTAIKKAQLATREKIVTTISKNNTKKYFSSTGTKSPKTFFTQQIEEKVYEKIGAVFSNAIQERIIIPLQQNKERAESYVEIGKSIPKLPQKVDSLFAVKSGKNKCLNDTKKLSTQTERKKAREVCREKFKNEKPSSDRFDFAASFFDQWTNQNNLSAELWKQEKSKLSKTIKSFADIPGTITNIFKLCPSCNVQRGSVTTWLLQMLLGGLDLPVFPFPKLPNITIDLSEFKTGLDLKIPDIETVPVVLEISKIVPTGPEIDEILSLRRWFGGFLGRVVTSVFELNFKGLLRSVFKDFLKKISVGPLDSLHIPKLLDVNTQIGFFKKLLLDFVNGFIKFLPSIGDILKQIPQIPLLPSADKLLVLLKNIFSFQLPKISFPNLPVLLPPPTLPDVLSIFTSIVQVVSPVFYLLCFLSAGFLPVPEWKVASTLQEKTDRTIPLPFEFVSAALFPKKIKPSFPDIIFKLSAQFFGKETKVAFTPSALTVKMPGNFTSDFTLFTKLLSTVSKASRSLVEALQFQSTSFKISKKTADQFLSEISDTTDSISKNTNIVLRNTLAAPLSKNTVEVDLLKIDLPNEFSTEREQKEKEYVLARLQQSRRYENFDGKNKVIAGLFDTILTPKNIPKNSIKVLAQNTNVQTVLENLSNTYSGGAKIDPDTGELIPQNFPLSQFPTVAPGLKTNASYAEVKAFQRSQNIEFKSVDAIAENEKNTFRYYESKSDISYDLLDYDFSSESLSYDFIDIDGDGTEEILYALNDQLYLKRQSQKLVKKENQFVPSANIDVWDQKDFEALFLPPLDITIEKLEDELLLTFSEKLESYDYLEWKRTERPDSVFEPFASEEKAFSTKVSRVGFAPEPIRKKYEIQPASAQITKIFGTPKLFGAKLEPIPKVLESKECENLDIPFYENETLLVATKDDTRFKIQTKPRVGSAPFSEWKRMNNGEEVLVDFASVCVLSGGLSEISFADEDRLDYRFLAKGNYLAPGMKVVVGEKDQVELELHTGRKIKLNRGETFELEYFSPEKPVEFLSKIPYGIYYGLFKGFRKEKESASRYKFLQDRY